MSTADMERYWMWLCSCPKLYRNTILALTDYFGSPKAVYEADTRQLLAWKKLGNDEMTAWVNELTVYKETTGTAQAEELLEQRGLQFVSRQSDAFPSKLRDLVDCPFGLFYRGHLPDPEIPSVSVVGARKCSHYGEQAAKVIGEALTGEGYQVISGMAYGIDGAAQIACVEAGGSSYAVLGCGADNCYPPENRSLYRELPARGGILSEYPPGTPPLRAHFPNRNRIIAMLSDAVIIVEAREKSGSLITADMALDQGKEVYAVPGRFNDALSYGCNRLIDQGAGIVLSTGSLLENLASSLNLCRLISPEEEQMREDAASRAQIRLLESMGEDEKKVYSALDTSARDVDEIARASGLTLLQTMNALLGLQLKHCAMEVSKNRYSLKLAS